MIEIIPAIDLIGGKCVRLTKGEYDSKKVYNDDPLAVAREFEAHGIRRLHLVDLDGAKARKIVNYAVLEKIASGTNLTIDFGGGLQSSDDLRIAFESGAKMVTGGSVAVKNPALFLEWLSAFGAEKIILGADVRGEQIAVSGWTQTSDCALFDFLEKYVENGVRQVICTDIERDGMLQGAAVDLYKRILEKFPKMLLVASGGVSEMADIEALQAAGVPAVITGKAIYEGRISLEMIEKFYSK